MPRTNAFARCRTVTDVLGAYESFMSPENLTCDGELAPVEIRSAVKRIHEDRDARLTELGTGLSYPGVTNLTPAEIAIITAQGWNSDSVLTVITEWNPRNGTRLDHMVQVATDEMWASYIAR